MIGENADDDGVTLVVVEAKTEIRWTEIWEINKESAMKIFIHNIR